MLVIGSYQTIEREIASFHPKRKGELPNLEKIRGQITGVHLEPVCVREGRLKTIPVYHFYYEPEDTYYRITEHDVERRAPALEGEGEIS